MEAFVPPPPSKALNASQYNNNQRQLTMQVRLDGDAEVCGSSQYLQRSCMRHVLEALSVHLQDLVSSFQSDILCL